MSDGNTSTSESIAPAREILGYTLKERIGSGGFGEVWSATAPGGMMKAVKIVYGYHDEKRAQSELKSLDRVKQLRHPFLLSLERIEVFEGQLIVVSELADMSMADLFDDFANKGEPGIPREQLVRYMRDAADALDYLSREHSLQHLDVKPENLLIVGSHVKVADFGLVKDLHSESMSLMAGMTPAYAAPELFDGCPGAHSDQYSLAIVYQEMLTSIRPFPGTTPAQLAAQHMHGTPNLRVLPKDDRPIIARALSKDPGVRFANCHDMVEELLNRKRTARKSIRRIQSPQARVSDATEVMGVSPTEAPDMTAIADSAGLPFQASQIQTLEPPECDPASAVARPTFIVGVGATGGRVVHRLKKQMEARHGSMEAIPSVRLLAIDSDFDDISRLTATGDGSSLSTRELIHAELKKPEFYRDQVSSALSWLGRRWIYNIPRSQNTEGLRPLGRLLFASYFESIYESIQNAIEEITRAEHLATTAETLEMNPGVIQPRVFIVSSISGGIGSGMMLDLAYAIKLAMAEKGLETNSVSGMMLHSTYQRTRDPGLAAANAFAFLTELRHFVESGYPGDKSLGIPDFEDEMPFDHTYFRQLGDNLSNAEFESQLSSVAEYIYLSAMTKCSVFLDACRNLDADHDHFSLRTCGLSVSGPGNSETGKRATNRLGAALIRHWIHGDPNTETDAKEFVANAFQQRRFGQVECLEDVSSQIDTLLEDSVDSIASGATELIMRGQTAVCGNLVAYLDAVFGCPADRQDAEYQEPELCCQLLERMDSKAMDEGDQLCAAIMSLLERPQFELSVANAAHEACHLEFALLIERMKMLAVECDQQATVLLATLANLLPAKGHIDPSCRDTVAEIVLNYGKVRLQDFAARFAARYYRSCQATLAYAAERIGQFRHQLEIIGSEFAMADEPPFDDAANHFSMNRLLNVSIEHDLPFHITQTESQVYESLIRERGGYVESLTNQGCWQHRLPGAIRTEAQQVLADAYKKISLDKVIASHGVGLEQLVKWLNEKINQARPTVSDCGGASRILIGLPMLSSDDSPLPEVMNRQFGVPSKSINGTRGNVVLCFEGEGVSLASVAYRLLEARPDAIELVKRLHTRNDVQWTTLNDLM